MELNHSADCYIDKSGSKDRFPSSTNQQVEQKLRFDGWLLFKKGGSKAKNSPQNRKYYEATSAALYNSKIVLKVTVPAKHNVTFSYLFRKYGVKINWICDAENGYALKGLLYAGRSSEERQIDLASTKVGQLVQPFVNSNRNVFMDRYFTSYSTVQHLFEHGHTATGTVFAHRRDVLACLRKAARRDPYSTLAVYEHSKKITMISYVPRKNSNVLLLTSCHAKLKVDNQQGFKRPNIINHYNLGKGAWMQKYNIFAIKKTNKYIMRCCTSSLRCASATHSY
ncbi:hypothetical protein T02_7711 [Trichinella nativa]|uniref:PiggyBac transposable element-derived protein domain-containing protein n=1 Tax=Trichinella nativa TaxID=6335 RepID=A0A0V1LPX1_9BILA|nr:hypothetical protein T02_7711 [Trichinella nativa]